MRILRIELRRSAALLVGVGIVVSSSMLLFGMLASPWNNGLDSWRTQWTTLAMKPRYLLLFILPFVLAIGAWQGGRDRRSSVDELLATTARPVHVRVRPVVTAMALGAGVSWLLVLAIGAVLVASATSYVNSGWVSTAAVGVLALVATVLLGLGIGRAVPSMLTPPILGVLGLVAMVLLTDASVHDSAVALLAPGFAGLRTVDVFHQVTARVDTAQTIWFASLAATGVALLVLKGRRRLVAVLPAVVGTAVTLSLLPPTMADALVADANAAELVCAEGTPRVCLTRAHASQLPAFAGPARRALTLLASLPQPPTAVEEVPTSIDAKARPDVIVVRDLRLSDTLLSGAGTAPCEHVADYENDSIARIVAGSWFLGTLTLPPKFYPDEMPLAEQAWAAFRALPQDQQRARIIAARQAWLTCTGDRYAILMNGKP